MKYGLTILLALMCVIVISACDTLKGEAGITCKDGVCKVYIPEQEIPISTAKPTPVPTPAVKPPEK